MKNMPRFLKYFCLATLTLLGLVFPVQAVSVYSANYGSGTISLWDTQGPYLATDFLTGLPNPVGVAVDPEGNVYITMFGGGGAIQKYSASGNFISQIDNLGYLPYSLRFDVNNILYVADLNGSVIRRYTDNLAPLPNWTTTNGLPTSIQFDGLGNVFVANAGFGDNVEKFSTDGTSLATIGGWPTLGEPHDTITDANGNIYVSSRETSRVVKFNSAGVLVNAEFIGGFDPYGLLIDGEKLFVAAHNLGEIRIYDLANDGAFLSSFSVGSLPTYIAVNPTAFVVPEPNSIVLFLGGGLALLFARRKKSIL